MRTAPSVSEEQGGWFVPDVLGNAESPEEDQVKIKIRRPKHGLKTATELDAAALPNADTPSVARITKAIILRMVEEVSGYQSSDGIPIKTGLDLFEHGEKEFVEAAATKALKVLGLDAKSRDQRNSDAQRASGSSETRP